MINSQGDLSSKALGELETTKHPYKEHYEAYARHFNPLRYYEAYVRAALVR